MTNSKLSIKNYQSFLSEAKARIQNTQAAAVRAANRELIQLYWWLGQRIVENQEKYGWGKSVVEELSKDLKSSFGGEYGFSTRNLWEMRLFYLEYKDCPNLQQLVAEIPWGQNLVIMHALKEPTAREYYLRSTREMGWSRNILMIQIKAQAYERHKLSDKKHNFEKALPEHLAEQAADALKDVYLFDTLAITKPIIESKVESAMVSKIKDVMLELGYGFSFMGLPDPKQLKAKIMQELSII